MGPSTTKPSFVGSGILQMHPTYSSKCVCNRCCKEFRRVDGFTYGDQCPHCKSTDTLVNTIADRAKTHGDFADNAQVSQNLKTVIHNAVEYQHLSMMQKESLDLICTKIGRILSGNQNEPDHWHDIAGYATLVENTLKKETI